MKGNKKLLVVAILLLLITVTYTTYAIYKTAVTGSATVTAAIWDVTFEDNGTELEENYEIEFGTSECTGNAHVKDGVIAPGATCTKQIVLNAGDTEVDVTYSASIGTITAEDSSGSAVSTANANAFSGTLSPSSGTIGYSSATRSATLTLTVTWDGVDDSASNPSGGTVVSRAWFTATMDVVLNLNGFTLTGQGSSPTIEGNGKLLVTGGTIMNPANQGAITVRSGGSVIVDNVTIFATRAASKQGLYNEGYAEVRNSYIETASTIRAVVQTESAATTKLISGTFVSTAYHAVVNSGSLILGTEDREYDITTPVLQGATLGIYTNNVGNIEFYDGIIMGGTTTAPIDYESKITKYEANTKKATGTEVISGATYQTLYREIDDAYVITLVLNGGTNAPTSVLVAQGGTIGELPTPDRDGYTFGGWYYDDTTFNNAVDTSATLSSSATFYAKWTQNITYTVNFNANGGTIIGVNSITYPAESTLGSNLPTAEKPDSTFIGWFTAANSGTMVTSDTLVTSGTTYYAHYSAMICKKATVLHTSSGTTYGQLPSGYTLKSGDAFDCDVNGDSVYDGTTERFYYLTTDNDDHAVLIFYNNFSNVAGSSATCKADGVAYGTYANGPTTAYTELPDSTTWPNVTLYSVPRTIKYENGTGSNQFSYTDRVARFATYDEIKAATVPTLSSSTNELAASQYAYLFENIGTGCRSNYWLETPRTNAGAFRMDASYLRVGSGTGTSAVRPVIEVPLNLIEVDDEPVIFDIIPTAMRNYYNNINTWIVGQSDSVLDGNTIINNHTSFDTAMGNNLSSNNCINFNGDNRDSVTSGSAFCDQPNQYDTGVNGPVNVYEFDTDTQTVSQQIASYVSSDTGKLYNFIPNKTYYWEDANDSSVHGYVKPTGERRILTIANSPSNLSHRTRNVRDLGGIKVDVDRDGVIDGTIKYGKMFRGEKIWGGDGSSVQYFTKLGITHEIDLRESNEPVTSEEDKLANYSMNTIVHYGIDFTDNTTDYWKSRNLAKTVMQNFVNSTDQNPYNLFFHCRIGADRTGTLAYILEGLLGATEEERYRDYELTVFFGLDERTRFYFNKTNNYTKFTYMKNVFKNAGGGTYEDVIAWFLQGSADTTEKCSDIALINSFRNKMIDSTSGALTPLTDAACSS